MHARAGHASDLDFSASCTAAEGWHTQTRAEFEGFYDYDPGGCLIAEQGGTRVGICVATSYSGPPAGGIGFVGELIVVPEARGQGIGRRLLDAAVTHTRRRDAQSLYLDAVLAAVPLYERAGFRKVCRSLRFSGMIAGQEHARVRPMCEKDLDAVCALDRRAFGADRRFFLERRWRHFPALCRVLESDREIAGLVLAARVGDLLAVGPWVVGPGVARPVDLLEDLAWAAPGCTLGLGVLETNAAAAQAARELGLTERADSPWRMVLGEDLGASLLAYAIGSPAKG